MLPWWYERNPWKAHLTEQTINMEVFPHLFCSVPTHQTSESPDMFVHGPYTLVHLPESIHVVYHTFGPTLQPVDNPVFYVSTGCPHTGLPPTAWTRQRFIHWKQTPLKMTVPGWVTSRQRNIWIPPSFMSTRCRQGSVNQEGKVVQSVKMISIGSPLTSSAPTSCCPRSHR